MDSDEHGDVAGDQLNPEGATGMLMCFCWHRLHTRSHSSMVSHSSLLSLSMPQLFITLNLSFFPIHARL